MTESKKQLLLKLICLALVMAIAAVAGVSFYKQRHFTETVVVSVRGISSV